MDFSEVNDRDRAAFDEMALKVSGESVRFLPGQAKVAAGEGGKWLSLAGQMKAMLKFAESRGFEVGFDLYAIAGSDLVDEAEIALSQTRGLQALSQLQAHGVPTSKMALRGLVNPESKPGTERASIFVEPLFRSHSEDL